MPILLAFLILISPDGYEAWKRKMLKILGRLKNFSQDYKTYPEQLTLGI